MADESSGQVEVELGEASLGLPRLPQVPEVPEVPAITADSSPPPSERDSQVSVCAAPTQLCVYCRGGHSKATCLM